MEELKFSNPELYRNIQMAKWAVPQFIENWEQFARHRECLLSQRPLTEEDDAWVEKVTFFEHRMGLEEVNDDLGPYFEAAGQYEDVVQAEIENEVDRGGRVIVRRLEVYEGNDPMPSKSITLNEPSFDPNCCFELSSS